MLSSEVSISVVLIFQDFKSNLLGIVWMFDYLCNRYGKLFDIIYDVFGW